MVRGPGRVAFLPVQGSQHSGLPWGTRCSWLQTQQVLMSGTLLWGRRGRGGAGGGWSLLIRPPQFSSVQSLSLVDSLQPHGLQHARPPCPSPTPGVYSNSGPWSRWCLPTIILCRPFLLLPSIFPSVRVFSSESVLHIRWPCQGGHYLGSGAALLEGPSSVGG